MKNDINAERKIIEKIQRMSGKYSMHQIFSDWIGLMAAGISAQSERYNQTVAAKREEHYLAIVNKYSKEEVNDMVEMMSLLAMEREDNMRDVLGEIYMKAGCGSARTGQFFTPYHLSHMTAKVAYEGNIQRWKDMQQIEINEPSTGGGGMIIAVAQVMRENDINFQQKMHVVAQDLDWNGVYMTYVQLSLLGIKAIVAQGDTLAEPYKNGYDENRVYRTPRETGVLI